MDIFFVYPRGRVDRVDLQANIVRTQPNYHKRAFHANLYFTGDDQSRNWKFSSERKQHKAHPCCIKDWTEILVPMSLLNSRIYTGTIRNIM